MGKEAGRYSWCQAKRVNRQECEQAGRYSWSQAKRLDRQEGG